MELEEPCESDMRIHVPEIVVPEFPSLDEPPLAAAPTQSRRKRFIVENLCCDSDVELPQIVLPEDHLQLPTAPVRRRPRRSVMHSPVHIVEEVGL